MADLTKIEEQGRLPEKLSDLIDLALKDLRKVEASDHYVVLMHFWHEPNMSSDGKKHCSVCFAGAVMAGTLGADPDTDLVPCSFEDDYTCCRLHALDSVRTGHVDVALRKMSVDVPAGFGTDTETLECYVHMPNYNSSNPEPFHDAMAALAVRLREEGL